MKSQYCRITLQYSINYFHLFELGLTFVNQYLIYLGKFQELASKIKLIKFQCYHGTF